MDTENIATAYLRYFATREKSDDWARVAVDGLVNGRPLEGWEITRALIARADSQEALAYVAAGPLEDLLNKHGQVIADEVERECLYDEKLQLALSGVSIDASHPLWNWWYNLMWKYGFAEGRRYPL